MAKRSVIRKGRKAIADVGSGAGDFVKIGDGDAVDMVSVVDMDEMLSVDQHAIWLEGGNSPMFPCIGKDCPGCELGNQPRFRAFVPVKLVETGEPKVFSFGIQIARALEELDEEFGGLAGNVFRVKRKGSGLATTYTVVALGKKRKVSEDDIIEDLEEKIGPTTRAGILALLEETGAIEDIIEEEELEEEEEEEPAPKKRKPRKKKVEVEEEEDEEDEDWEDV
jgi:hypothetical protein